MRIAIDTLIKEEKLTDYSVEVIKSTSNDESFSKIIKIMVKTPNLGKGALSELKANNYAWTTTILKMVN